MMRLEHLWLYQVGRLFGATSPKSWRTSVGGQLCTGPGSARPLGFVFFQSRDLHFMFQVFDIPLLGTVMRVLIWAIWAWICLWNLLRDDMPLSVLVFWATWSADQEIGLAEVPFKGAAGWRWHCGVQKNPKESKRPKNGQSSKVFKVKLSYHMAVRPCEVNIQTWLSTRTWWMRGLGCLAVICSIFCIVLYSCFCIRWFFRPMEMQMQCSLSLYPMPLRPQKVSMTTSRVAVWRAWDAFETFADRTNGCKTNCTVKRIRQCRTFSPVRSKIWVPNVQMSKVGAWFPEGLRNRGDPTVLQAQSCTGLAEAKEESCRQTARCQEFRAGAFSVPVRNGCPDPTEMLESGGQITPHLKKKHKQFRLVRLFRWKYGVVPQLDAMSWAKPQKIGVWKQWLKYIQSSKVSFSGIFECFRLIRGRGDLALRRTRWRR